MINNFQLTMMRRGGMSIAEIAEKTGIEHEEITKRLKSYNNSIAAGAVAAMRRAQKTNHHKHLHPEQG